MKPTGTDDKSAVDQAPLQELLSAAYTMQQHNQRLQTGQPPDAGYSQILKEILEIHELLRSPHLDLREKTALVARRVRQMTQASGSAVGLVNGDQLDYYAATGSAASEAGASMPQDSSLAHECLRTGQVLQCSAAETDPRLSQELCRSLGVKALIAVPVKHEGTIAGVLEVHFSQFNSFHEQEVRTCQLVSALVAESILKPLSQQPGDAVQTTPSPKASNVPRLSNINDTESLLAALEKIRPKLERLAKNPGLASIAPSASASTVHADSEETASSAMGVCRSCGHGMAEDEIFCGLCGSPRQTQHIWSSLLELQQKAEDSARQSEGSVAASGDAFDDPLDVFPSELEEIVAKFSGEPFEKTESESPEVVLPSFAQELVSENASSPNNGSDQESTVRYRYEECALQDKNEFAARAPDPAETTHEAARPFLIEKSPESAPPATETYPPFTGFASDTSLLSLPVESELETPSGSPAPAQDLPASGMQSATGEESSLDQSAPWSSAAKAKEWLEIERNVGRNKDTWFAEKWQQQRANIYLVAASLLLVAVLLGWALPSKPPAGSGREASAGKAHRHEAAPQPDLTLSEKLLVSLGLAEAPAGEVADPGNPDTQVWIDVHTALYYCPGADLYGKTPGGRTASQREAQQDQFQPAMRKACE